VIHLKHPFGNVKQTDVFWPTVPEHRYQTDVFWPTVPEHRYQTDVFWTTVPEHRHQTDVLCSKSHYYDNKPLFGTYLCDKKWNIDWKYAEPLTAHLSKITAVRTTA
jgi:hypothetical protein